MMHLIYAVPPWALGLWLFLPGFGFAAGHTWLVRRSRFGKLTNRHGELVGIVVTTAALFYSILLGFMTVAVWGAFGEARASAYREADLVESIHQLAWALPPTVAERVRREALSYVDHVVSVEWPDQLAGRRADDDALPLVPLRRTLAAWASRDRDTIAATGEMLRVLDELAAVRSARLGVEVGQIPPLIWVLIVAMALLIVGLAAFLPAESFSLHAVMLGVMTLTMVMMLVMLIELDHPYRGEVRVSLDPYLTVRSALLSRL